AGVLPGAFFRGSPARLAGLGIRFLQAPTADLVGPVDAQGLGEELDLPIGAGRPRLLPIPDSFATEVRVSTWMADAVSVPQGERVGDLVVRLVSGRELAFPLRAGLETGEWAIDRSDVRGLVRHARPRIASSFREPGTDFDAHRYLAVFELGGRLRVDGLRVVRRPGPGRLYLHKAGVTDGSSPRGISLVAAYLSDSALLREIGAAPTLRLFAVRGAPGLARVVDEARVLPDDEAVREALGAEGRFDPRREALLTAAESRRAGPVAGLEGARAERAEVVRAEGRRLELRAEGPGLLVLTTSFDPGWQARVDGAAAAVVRVNDVQMGVPLAPGPHRVTLRHEPQGLRAGLALAAFALLGLSAAFVRSRREEALAAS
ncbi:MAG TPA: YfhO family protein, partial [Vicinamibacteria bacterium]|nr:YfhO family protein [Vicinamibacteria bacterium]